MAPCPVEVTINNQELVAPVVAPKQPEYLLTAIDHPMALGRMIATMLLYKQMLDVPKLKQGLALVLSVHPQYSGRLQLKDDGRLAASYDSPGAAFITAVSPSRLTDLRPPGVSEACAEAGGQQSIFDTCDLSAVLEVLFPVRAFKADIEARTPLAQFLVVRLACGGCLLMAYLHHSVGDQAAAASMLEDWACAACSGQLPPMNNHRTNARELLQQLVEDTSLPDDHKPAALELMPPGSSMLDHKADPCLLKTVLIHASKERLHQLKQEAMQQLQQIKQQPHPAQQEQDDTTMSRHRTLPGSGNKKSLPHDPHTPACTDTANSSAGDLIQAAQNVEFVSTHDVLVARLMQILASVPSYADVCPFSVSVRADFRKFMADRVPTHAMGNFVSLMFSTQTDWQSCGLLRGAIEVRRTVKECRQAALKDLAWVCRQEQAGCVQRIGFSGPWNLGTTQWPFDPSTLKMPVADELHLDMSGSAPSLSESSVHVISRQTETALQAASTAFGAGMVTGVEHCHPANPNEDATRQSLCIAPVWIQGQISFPLPHIAYLIPSVTWDGQLDGGWNAFCHVPVQVAQELLDVNLNF